MLGAEPEASLQTAAASVPGPRGRSATREIFQSPYHAVWSGEFEEMEDAERRLMLIVPLSLGLIFILLYSAFRSFLDAVVVLSNVLALSMGGVWASPFSSLAR